MNNNFAIKSLLIFLTLVFAFAGLSSLINSLTIAHGVTSLDGQYVGRDFVYFYMVTKKAFAGLVRDLYAMYVVDTNFLPEGDFKPYVAWPWPYPPHSHIFLYPFSIFPYFASLALWLVFSISVSFYLLKLYNINARYFLLALLNINFLICLIMGQNTLILSSLLGTGIYFLSRKPVISALCFSVITIKPNFALLIPVVLLIAGYWRVLLYTAMITILWVIISCLLFGWDIWFIAAKYNSGVWYYTLSKESWFLTTYSLYRTLINYNIPQMPAAAFHLLLNLFALLKLQKIWRNESCPLKLWLSLSICMLLLTPYSVAYDAAWVAIPCLVWVIKSFNYKQNPPPWVYILFLIQIFSFAVISVSNILSILVILSALGILFVLDSKRYVSFY